MKYRNTIVIILLVILWGCQGTDRRSPNQPTYEAAKETVADKERRDPLNFLDGDLKWKQNLLGEFVIDGGILNEATEITYKDVVLEFNFLSKTKTVVSTQSKVIYEFFKPKQVVQFNYKLTAPKAATDFTWNIKSAKAVD